MSGYFVMTDEIDVFSELPAQVYDQFVQRLNRDKEEPEATYALESIRNCFFPPSVCRTVTHIFDDCP